MLPLDGCPYALQATIPCLLRPGNVHSAENWRIGLEPVVEHYHKSELRRFFRVDAAFAKLESYEFWKPKATATLPALTNSAGN